jgi:DNA-binding CsgD family transcriptional regulator
MDTRGRRARRTRFRVLLAEEDHVQEERAPDEGVHDAGQALSHHEAALAQSTLSRFANCFRLTPREATILDQLAQGTSPKGIASELGVSLQAIYAKLARVNSKVGCTSYPEVIAKLFRFSCRDRDRANASLPERS